MVRRDDDESPAGQSGGNSASRCDDPAGASPVSVSARAPSSRPAAEGEIPTAEAGHRKRASQRELISEERVREPQRHVKPAASTDKQSEGRAAHFTGKATSSSGALELGDDHCGVWSRNSSRLGTLVRYADDLVVVCKTKRQCEDAERDVRKFLARLGLELHPEKTKRVVLYDGEQGFDFLGCHFRKRLSGAILEREGKRSYFLHRQPSRRSMQRIRQKVRGKTQRGRCHADIREVIEDLNPVLRGWGAYFATGNAARSFNQIDARTMKTWTGDYFWSLGLHRLKGTVQYPEATRYRWNESPPASRVREIRTHGFYGGRMETRHFDEGK